MEQEPFVIAFTEAGRQEPGDPVTVDALTIDQVGGPPIRIVRDPHGGLVFLLDSASDTKCTHGFEIRPGAINVFTVRTHALPRGRS